VVQSRTRLFREDSSPMGEGCVVERMEEKQGKIQKLCESAKAWSTAQKGLPLRSQSSRRNIKNGKEIHRGSRGPLLVQYSWEADAFKVKFSGIGETGQTDNLDHSYLKKRVLDRWKTLFRGKAGRTTRS